MEKETILISRYITSPYISKSEAHSQHVCAEKSRSIKEDEEIMGNAVGYLQCVCAARRMDEWRPSALCVRCHETSPESH